jgi:hypothetical protein
MNIVDKSIKINILNLIGISIISFQKNIRFCSLLFVFVLLPYESLKYVLLSYSGFYDGQANITYIEIVSEIIIMPIMVTSLFFYLKSENSIISFKDFILMVLKGLKYWAIFIVGVVFYRIAVLTGLALFVVPGLYIASSFSLFPVFMIHQNSGLLMSFKQSHFITKGNKVRITLGLLFLNIALMFLVFLSLYLMSDYNQFYFIIFVGSFCDVLILLKYFFIWEIYKTLT